jgi:hypothetical protein
LGRQTWFSRRALALHAVIIVIVPTFAGLWLWQVHRVMAGNRLSWAYVFEWPFFAGYAICVWWRFVHEAPPGQTEPNGAGSGARTTGGDRPQDRASSHRR